MMFSFLYFCTCCVRRAVATQIGWKYLCVRSPVVYRVSSTTFVLLLNLGRCATAGAMNAVEASA